MPKKLVTKTIQGRKFEFGQHTATRQLKLLARLNRILLGPLGALAGDAETEVKLGDITEGKIDVKEACAMLADKMDEDIVVDTVKQLVEVTTIDGRPIDFDLDFQGEMAMLFEATYWSMEAQYGDFFAALKERVGLLIKGMKPAKSTSSGPSGDPSSPK